jgi:hypothetical protein
MRRKISVLIIGLLLFSALITSVHHHADNRVHDDCPVCAAAEHSPAASNGNYAITVSSAIVPYETLQKALYLPIPARTHSETRAPPLS